MKERFYAPDKTSELLDRLVKEQYAAGEVEVAHDLSNLRGMMMPFTLKDTREWEAWRNQFHQADEQKEKEARIRRKGSLFDEFYVPSPILRKAQEDWTERLDGEMTQFLQQQNLVTQEGQKFIEEKAKDVGEVSDEELDAFMSERQNTTDIVGFVSNVVKPLPQWQAKAMLDLLSKDHLTITGVEEQREMRGAEVTEELTVDYMPAAFSPLFGMSLINNDVYGLPNVAPHPFGDPQQLTEQCLKCRGTGVRGGSMPRNDQIAAICSRCKGTGRA